MVVWNDAVAFGNEDVVLVKPGPNAVPNLVILIEKSEAHPGGEARLFAHSKPQRVALTPAIRHRIGTGELVYARDDTPIEPRGEGRVVQEHTILPHAGADAARPDARETDVANGAVLDDQGVPTDPQGGTLPNADTVPVADPLPYGYDLDPGSPEYKKLTATQKAAITRRKADERYGRSS